MRAAASLPLPSTSASAASGPRRRSRASLRCSPQRRGCLVRARALDERLLEAAAPAPAPAEVEDEVSVDVVEGGGEEDGDGMVPSEAQGEQEERRSRRRQQQEEEADVAAERDRFKLINGKEIYQEKTYLVGVECKRAAGSNFGIEESLKELEQLADTAGLMVVGSTYQK